MFDFSWSEVALIIIVALIFIGPKDLPIAIRAVSRALKAMRRMASEFQAHVDDLVKDADLDDVRSTFRGFSTHELKSRFMKTIDPDRGLAKDLDFTPPPSLSSPITRPQGAPQRVPQKPRPSVSDMPDNQSKLGIPQPCAAPRFIPPSTAARIARERVQLRAPRFVPPMRVIHNGRRVTVHRSEDVHARHQSKACKDE